MAISNSIFNIIIGIAISILGFMGSSITRSSKLMKILWGIITIGILLIGYGFFLLLTG